MDRSGFFYRRFREHFPYEITSDQDRLFSDVASFLTSDDSDILVVNGYAGTGKTTAISAVIEAMDDLRPVRDGEPEEICILMAPTGGRQRYFHSIPIKGQRLSTSASTARNQSGRTDSDSFPWHLTRYPTSFS